MSGLFAPEGSSTAVRTMVMTEKRKRGQGAGLVTSVSLACAINLGVQAYRRPMHVRHRARVYYVCIHSTCARAGRCVFQEFWDADSIKSKSAFRPQK
eukprot:jgi/Botrbrau1/13153/Bobra.0187s0101.1